MDQLVSLVLAEYLEKALLLVRKYLFRFRIQVGSQSLILSSREAVPTQEPETWSEKKLLRFSVPESLDKRSDEMEKEILKAFHDARDGFIAILWSYDTKKSRVLVTQ